MAAKLAGWPPAPRHSWSVDRAAAEEWIRAYVEPVGAIETEHERPWATVLRVPLADGVAWFKECAPVQAFEPRLSAELFARWPDRVAEVLGHDEERAWLLLADAGTPIGAFGNPPEAWLVALPLYAELQRREVAHLEPGGRGLSGTFALAMRVGAFAHTIAWARQRDHLPEEARADFDLIVLRRALAQTLEDEGGATSSAQQ